MMSFKTRITHCLPFAGLLLALLLPMYGPWIDPTYATRQPYHTHLYLGGYDANHHHGDQHHHGDPSKVNCDPFSGVINLPDLTFFQPLLLL